MTQTQQPQRTLRPFIDALRPGNPIGHRNLTLVPLEGEGHGRLEYILAADAIAAAMLTVTEISEGGSVPELLASNATEQMILLLDGEELVGAKQNRILNTTVLLPAKSKTKIPVSCVEHGRWHSVSPLFQAGSYSPAKLRARKSRDVGRNLRSEGQARSDQGAVWDAVAANVAAAAVPSPTMAMHDVVEQRRDSIASYVEALRYPASSRGIVVALDGRFVALDLFDKPATLERIWPRLVTGYAMDAMVRQEAKESSRLFTAKGAAALLEHVGQLECVPCPTVGVGQDWRFEAEDIVGQALVAEDVCAHLCAFPNNRTDRGETAGPSILPPSRRGRRGGSGQR